MEFAIFAISKDIKTANFFPLQSYFSRTCLLALFHSFSGGFDNSPSQANFPIIQYGRLTGSDRPLRLRKRERKIFAVSVDRASHIGLAVACLG